MNRNARIDLFDTPKDMLVKMCDGNPGALNAMMDAMQAAPDIDPQSAFGSISPILSLDTFGVYGSRIWILYAYVCRRNAVLFLAALRAVQLGLRDENWLNESIREEKAEDIDDVLNLVEGQLENFNKKEIAA